MARSTAGFLGHGRLSRIGTLGEMARDKQKSKGPKGKGMATKGVSWRCRNSCHAECTSMSCQCDCGHRGINRK